MNYSDNPQLQMAYNFLKFTNQNVFLTGKAGTGKTTFLQNLRRNSPKRMVVLAPTGVAAINAGGATIHSFFQMPFGPHVPELTLSQSNNSNEKAIFKLNKTKIDIIRTLDLLVIDEISMVRADLLDGVDEVLRRYRNTTRPFGGVQLLLIGDLQQLAPVVKDDEWSILKAYYETAFFFSSKALRKTNYITVELKHIYRQSDRHFIDLLNKVRNNAADTTTFVELNRRYIPGFSPNEKDGYITLTTHNYQSNELNQSKLEQLKPKPFISQASVEGNFPAHAYPTEMELVLKQGAQVMFVKNDPSAEKLFYNGKIGKIIKIEEDIIYVKCPGDTSEIEVGRTEWQNMSYSIDQETKEIKETIEGVFIQYPLKLAWAITIHKSQGLTFEKVVIDAAQAFSHGQVYVALSRCKTLEGIVLSSRLDPSCLKSNSTVQSFNQQIEENPVTDEQLIAAQKRYERELIDELFDFETILGRFYGCQKVINQYRTFVLGQLDEVVKPLIVSYKDEIQGVGDKFRSQVAFLAQNGSYDVNTAMQERISKACPYFVEKLGQLVIAPMDGMAIETDNKEIRKEITESIDKLLTLAIQKKECLEAMQVRFSVKEYLDVRAKAALKMASKTKLPKKQDKEVVDINIKNPKVFNLLKEWRRDEAEDIGAPVYFIMAQKPLMEIANRLPDTLAELKKIKGIGESKSKKFGGAILEIVRNFKRENNITVKEPMMEMTESMFPISDQPEPKTKTATHEVSLTLFMENHSPEEVARIRGISVDSVIKHLGHYIEAGNLELTEVLDKNKAIKILEYFEHADTQLLKPAKDALGEDISYADLRLVVHHLKRKLE